MILGYFGWSVAKNSIITANEKNAQISEISEIPTIDQSDWTCPRLVIVHGQPLVPGTWITVTSCKCTKIIFLGVPKWPKWWGGGAVHTNVQLPVISPHVFLCLGTWRDHFNGNVFKKNSASTLRGVDRAPRCPPLIFFLTPQKNDQFCTP